MKILIICSKKCYYKIPEVKEKLEKRGIEVLLPNCYDAPDTEEKMWKLGEKEHSKFKADMYKQSEKTISNVDAVLVLNLHKKDKNKEYPNYIGGATFLEMYDTDVAYRLLNWEHTGQMMMLLNENTNWDEVDKLIEKQGHTGGTMGLLVHKVIRFSAYGLDFLEHVYGAETRKRVEKEVEDIEAKKAKVTT